VPSRSASDGDPRDTDGADVYILLDFLTGTSIEGLLRRHELGSPSEAEAALRRVLLRNGYGARHNDA
jgi:hypothetical protein